MNVCAIVLEYRAARSTLACLQSLSHQGIGLVLLVDNSQDERASEELAQAIKELRKTAPDYDLLILKPQSNLGFAGGVNFAIDCPNARNCDAFLLLNNDAILTAGSGQHLIDALDGGLLDLVAPLIIDDDGNRQPVLYYQRFFGALSQRNLPGSYPYFSGCCLLVPRKLLRDGKLFDEDFFMYGEDTLLGWRMSQEKKRVLQVPEATVRHRGQNGRSSTTLFYEYHITRAHILLAKKTARFTAEVPLLVCAKFAGLLLRSLKRCIRYRSLLPFHALLLAWRPIELRKT